MQSFTKYKAWTLILKIDIILAIDFCNKNGFRILK